MSKIRKLMWFVLGFGTVCVICTYTWWVEALMLPALVCGIAFAAMAVAGRKRKWLRPLAVLLLGCTAGFAWFSLYASCYLQNAVGCNGVSTTADIICTDYSIPNDYGAMTEGYLILDGKPYRVRVYLQEDPCTNPGDMLRGEFSFRTTTPDSDRASAYRQSEGIFLIAYARTVEKQIRQGKLPFWVYPAIWRQNLAAVLETSFPADTVGFAKAILLGDRRGIDYATNTAFKVSGISHIVAVSGLHVAILCSLLYRLCMQKRHLIVLLGVPVLLSFAAITGFSPSITRAAMMQILMILSLALDREYDGITALSFSCLVMLVVNPLVISSVSFQLSCGCMVGIFLFEMPIREWLIKKFKASGKTKAAQWKQGIARTISATLSSMSLTTPLAAYYFGAVSLIGVVTNLMVLWILGAVFYGILLVCFTAWLAPGLCGMMAWVISWPIRYILWISKLLASFPVAAVYSQSIYIVIWLAFCYAILALFCFDILRKPGVLGCCMVISLCTALCCSWMEPMLHSYCVSVLNVGQGQSILLQSDGRTFLVDCGGSSDSKSADIAAETILSQGTNHLDGIILTHYDSDHAGGVLNLLTRISADWVLVPKCRDSGGMRERLEEMMPDKVIEVSQTLEIPCETTKITIFPPVLEKSGNENSLGILFQSEKYGTLITGDRGGLGEKVLLQQGELPDVDVLIAGHHGAEDSTTQQLLDAISPEYVLISVGKNNYGHPHDALLRRLAENGIRVYRTDQNGTILFRR